MTSLQKPESRAHQRRARLNMKRQHERIIRAEVAKRDKYRCRACGQACRAGALDMLHRAHLHHIVYRSALGAFTTDNLLTVCADCHADLHAHRLAVSGNANGVVTFERGKARWHHFVSLQALEDR